MAAIPSPRDYLPPALVLPLPVLALLGHFAFGAPWWAATATFTLRFTRAYWGGAACATCGHFVGLR